MRRNVLGAFLALLALAGLAAPAAARPTSRPIFAADPTDLARYAAELPE